jgi:hypothetical protein
VLQVSQVGVWVNPPQPGVTHWPVVPQVCSVLQLPKSQLRPDIYPVLSAVLIRRFRSVSLLMLSRFGPLSSVAILAFACKGLLPAAGG